MEEAEDAGTTLRLAQRFAEAMRDPVRFGTQEVFSSCSMGVAHAAAGTCTPEELMRDADTAMYWAKREDRGGYAVFTEAMRDEAASALALQADLRRAIERGELVLRYQPICDAVTRSLIAVEALVRWRHPERGEIGPTSFIPRGRAHRPDPRHRALGAARGMPAGQCLARALLGRGAAPKRERVRRGAARPTLPR